MYQLGNTWRQYSPKAAPLTHRIKVQGLHSEFAEIDWQFRLSGEGMLL